MYQNVKVAVLMAAAGSGKRMGSGLSKQYRMLGDMPILSRAVLAYDRHPLVDSIYIIGREDELDYCRTEMIQPYGFSKVKKIIAGGKERQDSVARGLSALDDEGLVLIHDGARPFITENVITDTIEAAFGRGAAIAAVPAKDTIKVAAADEHGLFFTATPDRSTLYQVQTPQGFRREIIEEAHGLAKRENFYGTDDAVLVERTGKKVYLVMGDYKNLKITTSEDMETGEVILRLLREGSGEEPVKEE